jgi:Protein of unknown function (DUF2817)
MKTLFRLLFRQLCRSATQVLRGRGRDGSWRRAPLLVQFQSQRAQREMLYLDTARFGPVDARNMLVLIAGTHGVEGHGGSGAEIALAAYRRSVEAAERHRCALLVHAINPYGFAWSRRVTEDNADLNRNFVDHDKAYPVNAGYEEIAKAILPREWNEASKAETARVFDAYAQKHGAFGLRGAISGGQYAHPDGVFFGSHTPSWRNRTIRATARKELSVARRVGVIDFHTGLGPFGHGELICTVAPTAKSFVRARLVWRRDDLAREWHLDLTVVVGVMCDALPQELPDA